MGDFYEHYPETFDGSPVYCRCGSGKDEHPTEVKVNYNETCEKWWWCK